MPDAVSFTRSDTHARKPWRAGTFKGHSRDYSSVIAAIPILALVALCLLAATVSLMGAAFRTVKAHGTPRAAAVGSMPGKRISRAPRNPIHLLRWAAMLLRAAKGCPGT